MAGYNYLYICDKIEDDKDAVYYFDLNDLALFKTTNKAAIQYRQSWDTEKRGSIDMIDRMILLIGLFPMSLFWNLINHYCHNRFELLFSGLVANLIPWISFYLYFSGKRCKQQRLIDYVDWSFSK